MKKVVVTMGAITSLGPVEKVAKIREIKTICDQSDEYKASQPCQNAMSEWADKATELEKTHNARLGKEAELQAAIEEEEKANGACDAAGLIFGANVQLVAKDDPVVATKMGLSVRGGREAVGDLGAVTGVKMKAFVKSGEPRLMWDLLAGAVLYRAEYSAEPANDDSWVLLLGKGRSRKLPPLVRGQRYCCRVCAIGSDGKASPWSAVVTFVAP